MPKVDELPILGTTTPMGNDLEGVVYSLLHDRRGGAISMGPDQFREIVRKYVLSGWKETHLQRYYRLPVSGHLKCTTPGRFKMYHLEA
jgi:hypothetical protein